MNTTVVQPTTLLQLGGSTVIEHLAGEQTGSAIALIEFRIEPGYPVPPRHVHAREDEITYVIEGSLKVTIGNETRTVHAGESVFKPRGVPHAFAITSKQRVRFLETITPAGFEGYFRAISTAIRDTGKLDRKAADQLMAEYDVRNV